MSENGSDKKIGDSTVPGILHPYFIIDPTHFTNLKKQDETQKPKSSVDQPKTSANNSVDNNKNKKNMNSCPDKISSQHRNNTATTATDIEISTTKNERTTPSVDQNKTQFSLRRGKWTPVSFYLFLFKYFYSYFFPAELIITWYLLLITLSLFI